MEYCSKEIENWQRGNSNHSLKYVLRLLQLYGDQALYIKPSHIWTALETCSE